MNVDGPPDATEDDSYFLQERSDPNSELGRMTSPSRSNMKLAATTEVTGGGGR